MKQETFLYFIGTAGSGKSTLTASHHNWLKNQGFDSVLVNFDPGVDNLPYTPDVDIRDWISLKEIMETYELGPNGAQIACADMIALNTEDIKKSIESFKSDFILIDTPGQLELFVFREAGKYTIEFFHPEKTMVCYLIDPALVKTASGFVSQLLLSVNANFRLQTPQINLLSKADMLSDEDLEIIQRWSDNPENLYGALILEQASVYREMSESILLLLKNFGGYTQLIPTSKEDLLGMGDIYNIAQQQFHGGEDL